MAGDGFQKLHSVENSIIAGDARGADQVLRTISDKTDQDIFKSLIASHCDSKANGLPACTLDANGIHFGGDHKMTITDTNGQLGMRNDDPSLRDRARSAFESFGNASSHAFQKVKDSVGATDVGDSLRRAGTSDSDLNRGWNRQIQKAEGHN
ncbi:MAG TPA: hypothetical protein V6C97_28055 [Oculatellaceae cyanobacterium]